MVLPIPQNGFGPPDNFSSDILHEFDFGTNFDFGQEFSFESDGSWSVGSFDYDGISVEYSEDGSHRLSCRRRRRRRNLAKRMYRIESVKTSCWYHEFFAAESGQGLDQCAIFFG
jgi:hypothetical protein